MAKVPPDEIGKYTYGNLSVIRWGSSSYKVKVGSFCSIANGCRVILNGNHRSDWITTYPFGHINTHVFNTFDGSGHPVGKGDVIIGNDVWIGDNVTIMGGVTIGDGAVIAANSHVVKNVEPYSIHGGNPGRFIKSRFSEEDINLLLKLRWWEWPDDKINKYVPILCSSGNIKKIVQDECNERDQQVDV